MFDVTVIGGGVIGGLILRELTRYKLKVCLLEKHGDVAMGASKANSGIVHAGFDALPGTKKALFNVSGNKMMKGVTEELGVKYINNGALVVAFTDEDIEQLKQLKARGEKNGVEQLEIIERDELRALEPNISPAARAALLAKTSGIVCPYELTVAAIGNAMDNGAELKTSFNAVKIERKDGCYAVFSEKGERVDSKIIINCAVLGGGKIAAAFGDDLEIRARKGEYILLDRESGDYVSHTLFFTPTEKGKGILVSNTVDGNVILGPTAEDTEDGCTDTSGEGLDTVISKAATLCNKPPFYNAITSFAGVRAYSVTHDFVIEFSDNSPDVIHCIGIESPGLTASPAIADYVVNTMLPKLIKADKNTDFCGRRKPDYFFSRLSDEEKNEIINKDPSYGRIVCRCERITEGEILRALRENPRATDIDGVKRRTRAGMGRCQGGFCQPYVCKLISEELGVPLEKVTKKGEGSELLRGVTK